jgi:1,2-dihydroxy-3-keto-5-methylthiopentene dioxygenase
MSLLKIYPASWSADQAEVMSDGNGAEDQVLTFTDGAVIGQQLQAIGLQFERWQTSADLTSAASAEDILQTYQEQVERLKTEYGFASADVINLRPDHPDRLALRQKFLSEHTHSDFEVRFFVAGQGLFYIHKDGYVYAILCQRNDLISVPAGTRHWFDMGPQPSFTCIRLFTDPEGWVAEYTGSSIAENFPRLDQFVPATV